MNDRAAEAAAAEEEEEATLVLLSHICHYGINPVGMINSQRFLLPPGAASTR